MASIRKRGNSYQITVSNGYDINGKKILETTTYTPDTSKTPKQQEKALQEFVSNFEKKVKDGLVLKGDKLTLQEYSDKWLKEYASKNLAKTTYENYVQNLQLRILPALGHIKLSEIKPLHLQSFYNNLLEDGVRSDKKKGGLSAATIKKTHAVLSSMLKTAVQWQLIMNNPCDRVKPPKKSTSQEDLYITDIKYFTLEQTVLFLSYLDKGYTVKYKDRKRYNGNGNLYSVAGYTESKKIPTQLKLFYNLAIFGGLRRGELIALTWDDIDLETGIISVTKSTAYVKGEILTKVPKNKSSIRTIMIPRTVLDIAKQYKKEQLQYRLSLGDQWIETNHIFIQWNGLQMHPDTPYNSFKKIIKRYNDTITNDEDKLPNIPLHGLRHTSATLLISDNVDVRTVSARLGHSQTSTTMNIYAHALKEMDTKAANSLENLIKSNHNKESLA